MSDSVKSYTQRGTNRAYMIRQLTRRAPELAAEVAIGHKSAYAAAVEAGIVGRRFTVGTKDPAAIARTIIANLPPAVLKNMAALLNDHLYLNHECTEKCPPIPEVTNT